MDLFSATRNVLLGSASERKAVSLAGSGAPLKLPPGRHGAILGCWGLALTVGAHFLVMVVVVSVGRAAERAHTS